MRATGPAASLNFAPHEQLPTHSHGTHGNEGVRYPEEDSDEGWMSLADMSKLFLLTPPQDARLVSSGAEGEDFSEPSEWPFPVPPPGAEDRLVELIRAQQF